MSTTRHTRQQEWKAQGLCVTCGKPRDPASPIHCTAHLEAARTAKRNAYRKKTGIPLDAPIDPKGRKRGGDTTISLRASLATTPKDDIRHAVMAHCIDNKWSIARLAAEARVHYSTVRRFLIDPDQTTFSSTRAIAKAVGLKVVVSNIQKP